MKLLKMMKVGFEILNFLEINQIRIKTKLWQKSTAIALKLYALDNRGLCF